MLSKQYEWQTHHQIVAGVVHFLEENDLKPTNMSVSPDGWTEAEFMSDLSRRRIIAQWKSMEQRGEIEIQQPILTVDTHSGTRVHITFRIQEQLTRWQQIRRRFVS